MPFLVCVPNYLPNMGMKVDHIDGLKPEGRDLHLPAQAVNESWLVWLQPQHNKYDRERERERW